MKINDTEEVFQTYLHKYEDHDDDVMKVKAKVSRRIYKFSTFYHVLHTKFTR